MEPRVLSLTNWQLVNRELVKKMLTEFLYEHMLQTTYAVTDNAIYLHQLAIATDLYYEFNALPRIFGNWHILSDTIVRWQNGKSTAVTVNQFILDTYQLIGIDALTVGHLLRELNNTLIADCHLLAESHRLADLNDHTIEGYMRGHPWFVINKGRLGFSYADYLNYAPERRQLLHLSWIAVAKSRVFFNSCDIQYEQLIRQELSEEDIKRFNNIVPTPLDYYFMPIHPWQWQHQLIALFAADIAHQHIIYLGQSQDSYLPTLAVRTFNNHSYQHKYQVKLPLSIFNTAVYRGLPGDRTQAAPLLTKWLKKKFNADNFLIQQCRLILLGEIASIDYPHHDYNQIQGVPYQYKELLGVIWRENVTTYLKPSENAITMAALIHIDNNNQPFISQLIRKSNLPLDQWLARFFNATLPPLLHWLYQYGLVFSPHGENTMLILEKNLPVGLVIKDFIDDVNLIDQDIAELTDLPTNLKNILLRVDQQQITQFIHTGLFVVVYRYLSDILQTYENYPEADFWQQVHDVIQGYHRHHPQLSQRFQQFDLLKPEFNKMCLNRIRLLSVGYRDYDDRPKVDTIQPMKNPVNAEVINQWRAK